MEANQAFLYRLTAGVLGVVEQLRIAADPMRLREDKFGIGRIVHDGDRQALCLQRRQDLALDLFAVRTVGRRQQHGERLGSRLPLLDGHAIGLGAIDNAHHLRLDGDADFLQGFDGT
jgi:hypothetical protein